MLTLRDRRIAEQVALKAIETLIESMEIYEYSLEGNPFEVMFCNPPHLENLSGCKTDVSDAAWQAQLALDELLLGSIFLLSQSAS